jgi:hypothetical protein
MLDGLHLFLLSFEYALSEFSRIPHGGRDLRATGRTLGI